MKRTTVRRTRKGLIECRGYVQGRLGNVEIIISTVPEGWERLRINSYVDPKFLQHLQVGILDLAVDFIRKPKQTFREIDEQKLLAAILYRHFRKQQKKSKGATAVLEDIMTCMGQVYPDQSKTTFNPFHHDCSNPDCKYESEPSEIFRQTYVIGGEKVLKKLEQNINIDEKGRYFWEPLSQLEFKLNMLSKETKNNKIRKVATLTHELVKSFVEGLP